MEQISWEQVFAYPLDKGNNSYGFRTRLASENNWTETFTDEAILEYKKFMYLVATNQQMLSPSPIVDTVWHLHLLFSKKYKQFCQFLGKDILHQPSTHDTEEQEIYQQATAETQRLYELHFGKMPAIIWDNNNAFTHLNLPAAPYAFVANHFYLFFFGLVFILFLPAYWLALDLYPKIENVNFFAGALSFSFILYLLTRFWNNIYITAILRRFDKDNLTKKLTPLELIYTKNQNLAEVVAVVTNQLLDANILAINQEEKITLTDKKATGVNLLQKEIVKAVKKEDENGIFYLQLVAKMLAKPAFKNISQSMNNLKTHFYQSRPFTVVLLINGLIFALIEIVFLLRIATGLSFGKPILFITLASVAVSFLIAIALKSTKNKAIFDAIHETGKEHFWDKHHTDKSLEWRYLWNGQTALAATFLPLVVFSEKHNNDESSTGGGCGSSDGGSSCGGGCGGCGGGD